MTEDLSVEMYAKFLFWNVNVRDWDFNDAPPVWEKLVQDIKDDYLERAAEYIQWEGDEHCMALIEQE